MYQSQSVSRQRSVASQKQIAIQSIDQTIKTAQIRLQQLTAMLPVRSDLHLARKVWHAGMGLMIVGIFSCGISKALALTLLGSALLIIISGELVRLRNPVLNERIVRFFGPIIRTQEVGKFSTVVYYVGAAFVAIAVFPKPVAILSLLYLAIGDPTASLFGILFKNRTVKIFGEKSLHGTAAGFVACALMTYFYLNSGGVYGLDLIRLSLLGGFAGSLAEALPLDIDDNFAVPVVSGFILWMGLLIIHFV